MTIKQKVKHKVELDWVGIRHACREHLLKGGIDVPDNALIRIVKVDRGEHALVIEWEES